MAEVERHESVARRICQLLTDLGEALTVASPTNDAEAGNGE